MELILSNVALILSAQIQLQQKYLRIIVSERPQTCAKSCFIQSLLSALAHKYPDLHCFGITSGIRVTTTTSLSSAF